MVEDCRASGDVVWQACAQEALCIALALKNESLLMSAAQQSTPSSTISTSRDIWQTIPEKLAAVSKLYIKAALPLLAWDVHLTIAKISSHLGRVSEAILHVARSWQCCAGMYPEEKMLALAVIIEALQQLRCQRTVAFYQVCLASVLRQMNKPELAVKVLERTLDDAFGLYDGSLRTHKGPPQLLSSLLKELLCLSELHDDRRLFIQYSILYASYGHQFMTLDELQRVFEGIRKWVRGMPCIPVIKTLLPIFIDCVLVKRDDDIKVTQARSKEDVTLFIYAPPRQKSAQEDDDEKRQVRFLTEHELALFEVTLCNPMKLGLEFYVALRLSEGEASVETSKCVLPAKSHRTGCSIMLTPTRTGPLVIEGVEIVILGVTLFYPCVLAFTVLDRQPLLIQSDFKRAPECVFLYEGEQEFLDIGLENVSSAPIDNLEIKSTLQFDPMIDRLGDVLYSPSAIEQSYQLSPDGHRLTITLALVGILGCKSFSVNVTYGTNQEGAALIKTSRTLVFTIQCTIRPIMQIRNAYILPFSQSLIGALEDTSEEWTENDNEVPTNPHNSMLMIRSVNASHTSVGTSFSVEEGVSICLLVMEIANLAIEHGLHITFQGRITDQVRIAPRGRRRICLHLEQIDLENTVQLVQQIDKHLADDDIMSRLNRYKRSIKNQTGPLALPSREDYLFQQHIKRLISASWQCGSRSGTLMMHKIPIECFDNLVAPFNSIWASMLDIDGRVGETATVDLFSSLPCSVECQIAVVDKDGTIDDAPSETSLQAHSVDALTTRCTILAHEPCILSLIYRAKPVNHLKSSKRHHVWCKEAVKITIR